MRLIRRRGPAWIRAGQNLQMDVTFKMMLFAEGLGRGDELLHSLISGTNHTAGKKKAEDLAIIVIVQECPDSLVAVERAAGTVFVLTKRAVFAIA